VVEERPPPASEPELGQASQRAWPLSSGASVDPYQLCVGLVIAIVEHLADATASSSGVDRFEIEAQLLRQLMQDLPGQLLAAEEAAKMILEKDSV
jgi:hypothetical protein